MKSAESTEISSLAKWSAEDAKLLSTPAMTLPVTSKNSPADDITVEMKYADPFVPTRRPKKLGKAYPVRIDKEDEALIKKLCNETHLSKARILRLSCHAGLLTLDWTKFKRPVGAETKPVAPTPGQHPPFSLRILRHGVPEHVFSNREFCDVLKAIETLQCFWALV